MFATCSFPDYRPEFGGVPVRSSNGSPRYKLTYPPYAGKLLPVMPSTFPARAWVQAAHDGSMSQRDFYARYAELVHLRVDRIHEEAAAVRTAAGVDDATRVVLLCFCRLDRPGEWCHRSMFRIAWLDLTNETVPELGKTRSPEIRSDEQPGLF